MSRLGLLCLILFPFLAFAQTSNPRTYPAATSSASVVQVVYVVDGSTGTTYNIDQQTFNPTQVGTLSVGASTYPTIVTSPNGHFLYYIAYDDTSAKTGHLWVYTTDASGAPQTPPVQEMSTNGLGFYIPPQFHPSQNFFYAVYVSPGGSGYAIYKIVRFLVDPSDGRLSQPLVESTYKLESGTSFCALSLLGFNASGTKLYDDINCGYPGGGGITYYERSVNLQTGALGPDFQIYSWKNFNGGVENVQFVGDLMFDFVTPNGYQQGINSVNIYPIKPNTNQPMLQCTASMLQACGYASGFAHPSGKYVFMRISQDTTQIDKVELGAKKIVDSSHYIPYSFRGVFSPDGTIAYAYYSYNTSYYIEITGFDVATSNVTPGGVIYVPSGLDPFFVAQRY